MWSDFNFHVATLSYDPLLLPADEGSAGLRSHGTHVRLSDKGTGNAGRDSSGHYVFPSVELSAREPARPELLRFYLLHSQYGIELNGRITRQIFGGI